MIKKSPKLHSIKDSPEAEAEKTQNAERKKDHIDLAFQSKVSDLELDARFSYEPLLSSHPEPLKSFYFLQKKLNAPIWISSMTGGNELAYKINQNLARVCHEFGLGMGLGSCRILLEDKSRVKDFDLRPVIGDDLPFYANLGIAQIEQALENNEIDRIVEMVEMLRTNGLVIHVNPLQEWLQPEGDQINQPPIDTIKSFLNEVDFPVIVKEVGQGMGPESLKALFQLPLAAIEFAAHGGTNFSKVELMRSEGKMQHWYKDIAMVGHSAAEMVGMTNKILEELVDKVLCKQVIISGGIRSFLDGYYLTNKINCQSIYGQGSAFLEHAKESYERLREYTDGQIKGLELAQAYLKVK